MTKKRNGRSDALARVLSHIKQAETPDHTPLEDPAAPTSVVRPKDRFDQAFDVLNRARHSNGEPELRTLAALGLWELMKRKPAQASGPDPFDPTASPLERVRRLLGMVGDIGTDWKAVQQTALSVPEPSRSPLEVYLIMVADLQLDLLKEAVETGRTARERLGDDPILGMLESRAHERLKARRPARDRARRAVELCRAVTVGETLAEDVVEQAFRLHAARVLGTRSLKPMRQWWAALPASWQTPALCLAMAELELIMADGRLKSAATKQLRALTARTPAEKRDFDWHVVNAQIVLHALRYQTHDDRFMEAVQAIEAAEKCLDPDDALYDERCNALECLCKALEVIVDPSEILGDEVQTVGLPPEIMQDLIEEVLLFMMDAIGPQNARLRATTTTQESASPTVNPATLERLEKAGVTVHGTLPFGDYGTVAIISSPIAPKHIAYLVTLDANERRLARARKRGLPTRELKREGHEIAIAIPAREATKRLGARDWRLRLLRFIVEQAEHDDNVCVPGFVIKGNDGLALPSSDHNAVLLIDRPVLPEETGIRMAEVLPLFQEEFDYAALFSLSDLLDRLSDVTYFPPTRSRPNVCAGENWKTLIRPDQLKPLYRGSQPAECQVDPRVLTEGRDVRLFFRFVEEDGSSHWVFLTETNPGDRGIGCMVTDLNTVLNYLPYVGPYLEASPGSAFLRHDDGRIEPCNAWDYIKVAPRPKKPDPDTLS